MGDSSQVSQSSSVGGILAPVELVDFFAEYWEQKPLHIARSADNPFSELVDVGVIESLLSTHSLVFPNVQLSQAGQVIPVDEYTDENRAIVSERIIERYRSGSTIIISHAHKLHCALMNLCREVQAGLLMPCQTNVYLSPPGNQGFNPHFDTHDVFILQVSGKKTFSFYDGGAQLPTSADRFDSSVHTVGDKTEEIELNAGDTLYIPRGFVHDALADKDLASLHITLGVYPVLLHTLVNQLISTAMQNDSRLRSSVISLPNVLTSIESVSETIKNTLADHVTEQSIVDALSTLHDAAALDAKQNLAGQLVNHCAEPVNPHSELSINPLAVMSCARQGDTVILRTHGSVQQYRDPMGSAVEWLQNQTGITVKEIPGLSDHQQLALVEQLLNYNVLVRC